MMNTSNTWAGCCMTRCDEQKTHTDDQIWVLLQSHIQIIPCVFQQAAVRLQCVLTLQKLYEEKDFISRLELFTSRFKVTERLWRPVELLKHRDWTCTTADDRCAHGSMPCIVAPVSLNVLQTFIQRFVETSSLLHHDSERERREKEIIWSTETESYECKEEKEPLQTAVWTASTGLNKLSGTKQDLWSVHGEN